MKLKANDGCRAQLRIIVEVVKKQVGQGQLRRCSRRWVVEKNLLLTCALTTPSYATTSAPSTSTRASKVALCDVFGAERLPRPTTHRPLGHDRPHAQPASPWDAIHQGYQWAVGGKSSAVLGEPRGASSTIVARSRRAAMYAAERPFAACAENFSRPNTSVSSAISADGGRTRVCHPAIEIRL